MILKVTSYFSTESHYENTEEGRVVAPDQEGIDQIVISQVNDTASWDRPVKVRRSRPASLSIPGELAARAAFLANCIGRPVSISGLKELCGKELSSKSRPSQRLSGSWFLASSCLFPSRWPGGACSSARKLKHAPPIRALATPPIPARRYLPSSRL